MVFVDIHKKKKKNVDKSRRNVKRFDFSTNPNSKYVACHDCAFELGFKPTVAPCFRDAFASNDICPSLLYIYDTLDEKSKVQVKSIVSHVLNLEVIQTIHGELHAHIKYDMQSQWLCAWNEKRKKKENVNFAQNQTMTMHYTHTHKE